ncbi:MAG: twin-arginine translocase TatA/TatE family subunit [Gemmatimonadetes bacterium]|jgi:sec-independent protein translocase protein TatA|nr:twin-arginine translocase TatA/TatE family subunit [Gemmatimonadota bacterium]
MFGSIGMQEIVLILFILLLLFGAKRLPELGESLGKGIREFKRGVSEIKEDIDSDDQPKGGE